MKKFIGALAVAVLLATALPSCSTAVRPLGITSNPVGNKCGKAEYWRILYIFGGKADAGIDKAVKTGGITQISHADFVVKNYFMGLVVKYSTNVYGE